MGRPIKGTKQADILTGTSGKDHILGKAGDDTITGGLGNDVIDGGKGTDIAVFSGDYDDYVITLKRQGHNCHGNDDFMLTVAGADGIDKLKSIEWLQFDDAMYNVANGNVYIVNGMVDESAQKPATDDIIAGTGIPASGFGIVQNQDAGIELGLQVIYRQGPTVLSTDDYTDGVLHFAVNDGPQSTTNGSSSNNANRASWSFEFSIATGLYGEPTDLDDFTFQLLYDVDPSAATSYRVLTLEPGGVGSSGHQWRDQGTGLVFIGDDAGNANVTQNSENYAFSFFQAFLASPYGTSNAFAGPAQFDIILQAFDGSHLLASNHIAVDVIL